MSKFGLRKTPSENSVGNDPSENSSFVWANCRRRGWQVLVPLDCRKAERPEPPMCVIFPQKVPSSNSPIKEASSIPPLPAVHDIDLMCRLDSANAGAGVVTAANSTTVWKDSLKLLPPQTTQCSISPRRDFVVANKLNTTPPKRLTKTALLEQAAMQLRESEKIGSSLAEKLQLIKKQLEYN